MTRARSACLLVALVAGLVPAVAHAADPDTVLARIGADIISKRIFAETWRSLLPDSRPQGPPLEARREFLESMVDRRVLGREARRHRHEMTPDQRAEFESARRQLLLNAYFHDAIGPVAVDPVGLEIFRKRLTTVPFIRIFRFPSLEQARSWRNRLRTGTPMARLEQLVASGAPGAPSLDTLGWVPQELLPDSLRAFVFALHHGQVSDPRAFEGQAAFIQILGVRPRPASLGGAGQLEALYRQDVVDRRREAYRRALRHELGVRYDDATAESLLVRFQELPPRVTQGGNMNTFNAYVPLPRVPAADTARVLARVRGRALTVGDFLRYLQGISPHLRPDIRTREGLEAASDRPLLDPELYERAAGRDFERRPEVQAELELLREKYAVQQFYEENVIGRVVVNDDSLRTFFAAHPGRWNSPESVRLQLIAVERPERADSLVRALRAGADFAAAAGALSIHESALRGGDLGVVWRGQNPTFDDSLFAAQPGEILGPIATQNGYVILRPTAKTAAVTRSFDEALVYVRADYVTVASERILAEILARLREKEGVRVYPERVTVELGGALSER